MSIQPKRHYTVEEYLELERSTREKHELFHGEIFAMGGASEAHNLIVGNVLARLHPLLRGRPCRVYPSDLRVKISPPAYMVASAQYGQPSRLHISNMGCCYACSKVATRIESRASSSTAGRSRLREARALLCIVIAPSPPG
jgi:hypothetical protein